MCMQHLLGKMIKLFSLKQQSKDGLNPQSSKKTSAAYLRVQKGLIVIIWTAYVHESLLDSCSKANAAISSIKSFPRVNAGPVYTPGVQGLC